MRRKVTRTPGRKQSSRWKNVNESISRERRRYRCSVCPKTSPRSQVRWPLWDVKSQGLRGGGRVYNVWWRDVKSSIIEREEEIGDQCILKRIQIHLSMERNNRNSSFIGLLDLLKFIYVIDFPGFYCPVGSSHPEPCEAGSYCDDTGRDAPSGPCAAGHLCPRGSLNPHAAPCPAGNYCPPGTPLPLPCPVGTITSEMLLFFSFKIKLQL